MAGYLLDRPHINAADSQIYISNPDISPLNSRISFICWLNVFMYMYNRHLKGCVSKLELVPTSLSNLLHCLLRLCYWPFPVQLFSITPHCHTSLIFFLKSHL